MSTTQTEFRVEWKDRRKHGPELRTVLSTPRKAFIATSAGLAGGIGMAVPIVIYGWATAAHSALELPMAATAWLFGLGHFTQNGYGWWPIVVGVGVLVLYALAHGAVFGAVADRFLRLRTLPETIGAGFAWAFVSWMFFWYTVLPIARDGAPFRTTAVSSVSVAPTWIFLVGFTALGLVTSLTYWLLHGERRDR
ncbi:MAG TPA: hypothetical protein VMU58_12010 [Gaiellaceae bacterium]|nr:hypothetical protein [Gaiellaceae bacterium]